MSDTQTFTPEVQQRIEEVTEKFNAFIAKQKTEIIKSKEEYTGKLNQLRNDHHELLEALKELESKEIALNNTLEREIIDSNSAESRLNVLRAREEQLGNERKSLESQVNDLKERTKTRREEFNILKQNQQKQSEINLPEALLFEQLLGFQIVGLKDDLLKLVFKNINQNDPNREFTLNLDVSEHLYKVCEVQPPIPEEKLKNALDSFNESRDLTSFLKDIRTSFKSLQ